MRQKIRRVLILASFLGMPVTFNFFSPVLSVSGAKNGIVSGSLVFFGILAVSALVFGRVFCGWLCPGGGLQEALAPVNDWPARRGAWIKYAIWASWFGAILVLFVIAGKVSCDPLYMMRGAISVDRPAMYIPYYSVLLLIALPALLSGRRSFCKLFCWMAPFMVAGRKLSDALRLPGLHLRADAGACSSCGLCARRCPMGLDVQSMVNAGSMRNSECVLCGECADACGKTAIAYGFLDKGPN